MSMTAEMEKVMKRVQKLLNLADGNQNENEAQAALLKAQKMMAENNISMSDVNLLDTTPKKEVGEASGAWMKIQWFHKAVASVIADNFRCYWFYRSWNGKSKLVFMGLKADAELAQMMFDFAILAVEYNADEYVKEQRQLRYIRDSKGIKTDYMKGFIRGLSEKFKEQSKMKVQQETTDEQGVTTTKEVSMALVLVKDDALVEAHKAMKLRKGSTTQGGRTSAGDTGAYNAGKEKGKKFEASSGYLN
jgi:hypothetical protein